MKKIIIAGVIFAVAVGLYFVSRDGTTEQQVSNMDITDIVADFYDQWLEATQRPETANPNRASLANSPILSEALRTRLVSTQGDSNIKPDPVLCQTTLPENISIRNIYVGTDKAQLLVMSRDKSVTEQAVVTLISYKEGWYIDNIECSPGEIGPEREFSFEREGHLLKDSLPSPYDSKIWHLVFEENGEVGRIVPLFFDVDSQCTNKDGSKAVCQPDQFTEATKVLIRGQMGESGLSVKQQEFVE